MESVSSRPGSHRMATTRASRRRASPARAFLRAPLPRRWSARREIGRALAKSVASPKSASPTATRYAPRSSGAPVAIQRIHVSSFPPPAPPLDDEAIDRDRRAGHAGEGAARVPHQIEHRGIGAHHVEHEAALVAPGDGYGDLAARLPRPVRALDGRGERVVRRARGERLAVARRGVAPLRLRGGRRQRWSSAARSTSSTAGSVGTRASSAAATPPRRPPRATPRWPRPAHAPHGASRGARLLRRARGACVARRRATWGARATRRARRRATGARA